jgi:hypothetical protein
MRQLKDSFRENDTPDGVVAFHQADLLQIDIGCNGNGYLGYGSHRFAGMAFSVEIKKVGIPVSYQVQLFNGKDFFKPELCRRVRFAGGTLIYRVGDYAGYGPNCEGDNADGEF